MLKPSTAAGSAVTTTPSSEDQSSLVALALLSAVAASITCWPSVALPWSSADASDGNAPGASSFGCAGGEETDGAARPVSSKTCTTFGQM